MKQKDHNKNIGFLFLESCAGFVKKMIDSTVAKILNNILGFRKDVRYGW